jgi:hypothetical protein
MLFHGTNNGRESISTLTIATYNELSGISTLSHISASSESLYFKPHALHINLNSFLPLLRLDLKHGTSSATTARLGTPKRCYGSVIEIEVMLVDLCILQEN